MAQFSEDRRIRKTKSLAHLYRVTGFGEAQIRFARPGGAAMKIQLRMKVEANR
jgi:hypothetical protein